MTGDQIYVEPGNKSPTDFIVRYRSPGKKQRTPKHIHLVVDLYSKLTGNEDLTMQFIDLIIEMIQQMTPATSFPPALRFFSTNYIEQFDELNNLGEYSVEFLLVVIELIMLQEKTNYPEGSLNLKLFRLLRQRADIFSIVSAATFR